MEFECDYENYLDFQRFEADLEFVQLLSSPEYLHCKFVLRL